jgi:hypothetical protein
MTDSQRTASLDGLAGLAAREAMEPLDGAAQCEAVHPILQGRCDYVRHTESVNHWHGWDDGSGRGYTWLWSTR